MTYRQSLCSYSNILNNLTGTGQKGDKRLNIFDLMHPHTVNQTSRQLKTSQTPEGNKTSDVKGDEKT